EPIVDGEAVSDAEVVAICRGVEIQRHRHRLAVRTRFLRQAEVERPSFFADQNGAGEQVAGSVANLDGVEHRVVARLFRTKLAEGGLGADQAERKPRQGREDPRESGPAALHRSSSSILPNN